MAKQTFTALQVLTAAQQNALQANDYNQTVSTKTASYTLVATDVGTKIVMNAGATNTTITVNTSLFAAGDTLTILNTSTSGTCTVTAGTCTVASAGSLALGLNQGGTLYFTSAGVSVFQADGVTATTTGLVPITPTSISVGSGTATSAGNGQVTFTGVGTNLSLNGIFSATYTNYLILISKVTASGTGGLNARLRSATTDNTNANYDQAYIRSNQAGTVAGQGLNAQTQWYYNMNDLAYQYISLNLFSPFVTGFTGMQTSYHENDGTTSFYTAIQNGQNQENYSADGLTFLITATTVTGKVTVYGYTI